MSNELSRFEKAILEKLLDGDIPLFVQLRQQLELCSVVKREFTGFGFYTTLAVPEGVHRTEGLDLKFGDVIGEIPD